MAVIKVSTYFRWRQGFFKDLLADLGVFTAAEKNTILFNVDWKVFLQDLLADLGVFTRQPDTNPILFNVDWKVFFEDLLRETQQSNAVTR